MRRPLYQTDLYGEFPYKTSYLKRIYHKSIYFKVIRYKNSNKSSAHIPEEKSMALIHPFILDRAFHLSKKKPSRRSWDGDDRNL